VALCLSYICQYNISLYIINKGDSIVVNFCVIAHYLSRLHRNLSFKPCNHAVLQISFRFLPNPFFFMLSLSSTSKTVPEIS
jgi:hypothetical protein